MYGVRQERVVFLFAIVASVILSFWAAARTSVINPDGICYLQSAAGLSFGLNFAMHLCDQASWPFYSILIHAVVTLTHLSYTTGAFVLNGLLTAVSVVMFLAIVRTLTPSIRILWLALAVILLPHEFNSVRTEIIRDHGFWAFYLMSLFFLLHFFRQQSMSRAILWNVSLLVATLFRIEGAIFLLLLPFVVWFDVRKSGRERLVAFFQLNLVTMLLGVVLLAWVLGHPDLPLGRLSEIGVQFSHGLSIMTANYQRASDMLGRYVLSVYSARDASYMLFIMLTGWYVTSVAVNVSLVYAALIVYAWSKRLLPSISSERVVLWGYVCVNILITSIFLFQNLFLSKRYLLALSLVLMVWVPFALDSLIDQYRVRKWPLALAIFFILFYALGGIFDFGHSKKYIRHAGAWLSDHVPQEAKIYSNDYLVMYYSNHFGNSLFAKSKEGVGLNKIAHDEWRQYDYLAVRLNHHDTKEDQKIIQAIPYSPIQVFANKRGDEVRIYKVIR